MAARRAATTVRHKSNATAAAPSPQIRSGRLLLRSDGSCAPSAGIHALDGDDMLDNDRRVRCSYANSCSKVRNSSGWGKFRSRAICRASRASRASCAAWSKRRLCAEISAWMSRAVALPGLALTTSGIKFSASG